MCLLSYLILLFVFCVNIVYAKNVHEYTLKNGLHLLVKEDHRAPVAIFEIWYRVGGSYEPNGITGISHVLEHMMFQGSKNYPGQSFSKIIGDNGGILNAFTDDDFTAYYEELAKNKIVLSFKLEADRMHHATLNQLEFNKEIQVVMEEQRMRIGDRPQSLLYQRVRAAAFLSNPYHHLTIGWKGDLQHMTIEKVRNWYHRWYVPNNATIVIVGDVQPQHMLQLAKRYFEKIAPKSLPASSPTINEKPLGERVVNVSLSANIPYLIFAYNVPVINSAIKTWQPYALDVLANILAGSDSSRLPERLVRKQRLANSISCSYSPIERLSTIFTCSAVPAEKHTLQQVKTALLKQIKYLKKAPISPAELRRIKIQVIATKIYSRDSLATQANELGAIVSVGLPWKLTDNYAKHIQQVTASQVQQVAKDYLQESRLTIGLLHPLPLTKGQKADSASSTMGGIG